MQDKDIVTYSSNMQNHLQEATVIKNTGSHYLLSKLPEWNPFPAILKGKLRLKNSKSTNPVSVGDRVLFESEYPLSETDVNAPASITEILPRKNMLVRKSANLSRESHVLAANIDTLYAVVSLYFPEIKLPFLDRVLVTCRFYGIPVTIVMNKTDLYRESAPEFTSRFLKIYRDAGYKIIETSVETGEGIDALKEDCKGQICLLTGESGVGKSSLINSLDPSLDLKTGEISESHLQGKHTTSFYEMFKLECGGFLIDSPGIRGFGLAEIDKNEIALYFPEMFKYSEHCKFSPCSHTHEPGCAVKEAVEKDEISAERYNSYLGMLEEDTKFRK